MSNIGFKENLVNEFKSDRTCLPDSDIIDAVVAFANTEVYPMSRTILNFRG